MSSDNTDEYESNTYSPLFGIIFGFITVFLAPEVTKGFITMPPNTGMTGMDYYLIALVISLATAMIVIVAYVIGYWIGTLLDDIKTIKYRTKKLTKDKKGDKR